MSVQITLTPEKVRGVCPQCHREAELQRFYVEVDEHSGTTDGLCPDCFTDSVQDRLRPTRIVLEDPPQDTQHRPPSRRRRKVVDRQERETAEKIGGYRQAASGAMPSAKGDVRCKGTLRGEMKSTEKGSFIIKRSVLDKIRGECVGAEKPFVTVRFIHPITMATEDEWVLIPIEHWEHNKNATP